MKIQSLIFFGILSVRLMGQPVSGASAVPVVATGEVLRQSVIYQPNGNTFTFKQVVAPQALPLVAPQGVELTAQESETLQRRKDKEFVSVKLGATVYANGYSVVRCGLDDPTSLKVVSNTDFRLLIGLGEVETEAKVYNLFMSISGASPNEQMDADEANAALELVPSSGASYVVLTTNTTLTNEEQKVKDVLDELHEYVHANRVLLTQMREQREAEQATREFVHLNTSPAPPKQVVLQFWKMPRLSGGLDHQSQSTNQGAQSLGSGATKQGAQP